MRGLAWVMPTQANPLSRLIFKFIRGEYEQEKRKP